MDDLNPTQLFMTVIQSFSILYETTTNPLLFVQFFFYGKGFVVQNVFGPPLSTY